jgi:D-tyrosyl-tRNA(Tyr) deacylase
MRVLIQRVSEAQVRVAGQTVGAIGPGLLLLVGVEEPDGADDIDWLTRKLLNLRIFEDQHGVMNRSVLETGGEVLAVSQFTLFASCKKGNRPSYSRAARPELSKPLFDRLVEAISQCLQKPVPTGVFGADMKVGLINDGPVTIFLDSRERD